jgi:hypothetical protein
MNAKEAKAGAPASIPREQHTDCDVSDILDSDEKKVSVLAVKSVAAEYRIDFSIFRGWLVERGFQIQEEA